MGSIPAWAGETALQIVSVSVQKVYPRVGGGNRANSRTGRSRLGLSPRGRGKRRHCGQSEGE